MNRVGYFVLFTFFAQPIFCQTSSAGPLGVLISPPKKLTAPPEIRSVIPARCVVRLIQPTQLTSDGETIVIYETGNQYEPHAHLAVIKNRQRAADFSLVKLFAKQDVGDTYALFQAAQISLSPDRKGFMAAFRNIGDGAGTLYVLVTGSNGQYAVAWQNGSAEAQFRVLPGASFQLWDADEGDDCVWCPHHYKVTNYVWKNTTLARTSSFNTKQTLSPYQFSEKPIRIAPR